jgi:hypothetical protein
LLHFFLKKTVKDFRSFTRPFQKKNPCCIPGGVRSRGRAFFWIQTLSHRSDLSLIPL